MRFIILFLITLFFGGTSFAQTDILLNKTWNVLTINNLVQDKHIVYYHKDSTTNYLDFDGVNFTFEEDGTYLKKSPEGNPIAGTWSVDEVNKTALFDSVSYETITLTEEVLTIRTYSLRFLDTQGSLDTIYQYLSLYSGDNVEALSFALSGNIATENATPVEEVLVNIAENTTTTNEIGDYNELLLANENYTIKPSKTDVAANGLTVTDLALIQAHILGLIEFDSPYKRIAADVNNTSSITTMDLVVLQKIILGIDQDFGDVPVWRFIPKAFDFDDPKNPFAESFPDSIQVTDFAEATTNLDFVAIKMGDVNHTASPNLQTATNRNIEQKIVSIQDEKVALGEEVVVTVTGRDLRNILGYQMGLSYKTQALELLEVLPTEGFDFTVKNGLIRALWTAPQGQEMTAANELFQLRFRVLESAWLSDLIGQNDRMFEAYAVDNQFVESPIQLRFETDFQKPLTIKVYPNPTIKQLTIEWEQSLANHPISIQIFNNLGQSIFVQEANAGQQISLDVSSLKTGLYTIELLQNGITGQQKFVKVE